jgi:inactivated superfamily I helicase
MPEFNHNADLQSLLAAIAASQIVVPGLNARDFADWCQHQQPDIDTVILGWLRSHVSQAAALS